MSIDRVAWIQIAGGTPLPSPAFGSGGISISTAVDGGKNAKGNFIGSVIGDDKLKYDISFAHLTPTQFQEFLKLFDRNQGGKFSQIFSVYDPRIDEFIEIEMYVGDRGGRPVSLDGDYKPTGWLGVGTSLIQL